MSKAKVLFWDIETLPMTLYRFSLWQQGMPEGIIDPVKVYCIGYKWEGGKAQVISGDEGSVLSRFSEVLTQADLMVYHNGDSFDKKVLNARLAANNLPPVPPILAYDTRSAAKRLFRFESNKLDYLGQVLGLGRKVEHEGFGLWRKVAAGDKDAHKRMVKYCKGDVDLLERVYNRLVVHDPRRPRLLGDGPGESCPHCGSSRLTKRGYRRTILNKFQRWQCEDCGHWHQSQKREK